MTKSFVEFMIGDIEGKKAWRQLMKRVNALPEDYRYTYKKILNYGYNFGFCCITQSELLEMFEENAALGKSVIEVVGSDIAAFCDELIRVSTTETDSERNKLNQEILEYFRRKEPSLWKI